MKKILPSIPAYRIPIDTSKIIEDDNGGLIVSDRINIALKDKTKKLEDFSIDLKKAYPDSTYRIIYYDNETSRLQLQFPEVKRNTIKEEIRKKMEKYHLLIWDESVFHSLATFNDPSFKTSNKSWYFGAVNAQKGWDISHGDSSVIIAIVDDGFDLQHPELINKRTYPYNVRTHTNKVYGNSTLSHGTHIAGIALANNNNNYGTSGIAPHCSFMPIQIADESNLFTSTDVIDGVLYAIKHKASVINLSLGKQFSNQLSGVSKSEQEFIAKSTSLDEAVFWNELFEYANKENVSIVIAAGNQNILIGMDPMQRSQYTIVVSAVNNQLNKASFSNYGSLSTVSAPGVGIFNCIPNQQFDYFDGTSMSAPIITGTVALMKSVKASLKNNQIINILQSTGKNLHITGLGPLVQIDKALESAKKQPL